MCPERIRLASIRCTATIAALALLPSAGVAQRPAYRDASVPIERRITDLLSRMTLEEKVAQMMCLWDQKKLITDSSGHFNPARAP